MDLSGTLNESKNDTKSAPANDVGKEKGPEEDEKSTLVKSEFQKMVTERMKEESNASGGGTAERAAAAMPVCILNGPPNFEGNNSLETQQPPTSANNAEEHVEAVTAKLEAHSLSRNGSGKTKSEMPKNGVEFA